MDAYIAMMAIVLPGFITKTIVNRLNTETKKDSDAVFIVEALSYSLIVLGVVAAELALYKQFKPSFEFNDIVIFMGNFTRIDFLMKYILIAIIGCIISAVIIDKISPYFNKSINLIRGASKKSIIIVGPVWSNSFDDNCQHAISIEIDNKAIIEGFIGRISGAYAERTEIYIEKGEQFAKYKDKLFKQVKGTYVDFDKKIIITEYDLSLYNSVIELDEKERKKSK